MKYLYHALLASFIILSSTTLAYAQTVVLAPITTNTTWTAANGPFLIGIPVTIQSGATLTIEPGTIVKFTEQSAGLEIETGATLSAQGTAGQPIYFTSYSDDVGGDTNGDGGATTPTNRQWGRIVNFGTLNLANAQVRYGGYIAGGLSLRNGSVTSLTSAIIHDMGSDGISLSGGTLTATGSTISNNGKGLDQSGGSATFTSSTFSNNTQGFEVQGTSTSAILTGNTFTNNTQTGVFVNPGTITQSGNTITGGSLRAFMLSGTLNHPLALSSDVPYVVNGVFTITASGELIVPAGAIVKFRDTSSGITVQSGGILTSQGTEESPVLFTDIDSPEGGDTDGDGDTTPASRAWGKIQNAGMLTLSYTTLSYGGYVAGGLTFTSGSTNTLDHVHVISMGSDGISQQGGTTEITYSSISGHGKGIEVTGGTLSVHMSSFTENFSLSIDNNTLTSVDATNNWWADRTGPQHPSNVGGAGESISNNVSFVPFLKYDPTKVIKVAVILAEAYDVRHVSSQITNAQPCKKRQAETYPYGHNKVFYEHFYECITDYYREVSKGTVNLEFTIFDNNGQWYTTAKNQTYYEPSCLPVAGCLNGKESEFISDVLNLTQGVLDRNAYDAIIVKHSANAQSAMRTQVPLPSQQPFVSLTRKVITALTSEYEGIGADTHELGHILGGLSSKTGGVYLPDVYDMGLKTKVGSNLFKDKNGDWELMASGSENGLQGNPPHLSSFMQEFLGWINYREFTTSNSKSEWITPLVQIPYGGDAITYSLSRAPKPAEDTFYIIEKRDRALSTWDSSLPGQYDKNVLLYYVETNGFIRDGWRSNNTDVASLAGWDITLQDGAILNNGNSIFKDWDHLISFTITGEQTSFGIEETRVTLSELSELNAVQKIQGVILRHAKPLWINSGFFRSYDSSDDRLSQKMFNFAWVYIQELFIISILLLALMLLWTYVRYLEKKSKKSTKVDSSSKIFKIAWVIVLLIFANYLFYNTTLQWLSYGYSCPKNYSIPCARAFPFYAPSGSEVQPDLDLHAITPDGRHVGVNYVTGEYENQIAGSIVSGDNQGIHEWIFVPEGETVRYYISARDNERFLAEHPEITDTTDSFSIYARTLDPETGVFTSETVENQTIVPTQERVFEVSGTEQPTIIPIFNLSLTADNQRLPQGSEIPALTYTLSGFDLGDTVESSTTGTATCTTTATNTSPVGTYPITCSVGTFVSTKYTLNTFTAGTLTVIPTLTVSADDVTVPQGSEIPTLTASISGFINGDTLESATVGTPDCTTTATVESSIGTYPIVCAVGTLTSETYAITTYVEGILTILPQLTVTAEDKTMTEGGTPPSLTATLSGFINGDTQETTTTGAPVCTTPATPTSVPGAYPITCEQGTLNSNAYAFTTFVDGTLTVEPAIVIRPLTVTADNKSIMRGASLPSFTYALSGFVNGDTAASSTTGSALCTTTATPDSPVGTYPITCTEGTLTSATYTFADFVAAELTVTDGTPPELQAIFDATLKDVVLSAVDSVDEQPTFSHTGNVFTLTDSAGNITKINLTKYKESATRLRLTYTSITRNGVTVTVPQTTIMYDWALTSSGVLKDIDSKVTVAGVEKYMFTYNRNKDQTKIKVKNGNSQTTTTRSGFVTPAATTDGNGVIVAY